MNIFLKDTDKNGETGGSEIVYNAFLSALSFWSQIIGALLYLFFLEPILKMDL